MGLESAARSEAVWVEYFGYCDGVGNVWLGGIMVRKAREMGSDIFIFSISGAGLRSMG